MVWYRGLGTWDRASVFKDDLTYLDLRGKVIHSLLFSKHLTNLEHQNTSNNDHKMVTLLFFSYYSIFSVL